MRGFVFTIVFLLITNAISSMTYDENTEFMNTVVLMPGDEYVLHWTHTETDIVFKIQAKTNGSVRFGLSDSLNSVVFDGIIAESATSFVNAYYNAQGISSFNNNHWEKLFYSQNNGVTTVIARRLLKVCTTGGLQKPETIDVSLTNIINYSIGNQGNDQNNRKSLQILGAINEKVQHASDETLIFESKFNLPNNQLVMFHCQVFQLPTDFATTKKHLLQYFTYAFDSANVGYATHIKLHECPISFETIYSRMTFPDSGDCMTMRWMDALKACPKSSLSWSRGAKMFQSPSGFGYPMGGNSQKYAILYIRYEIPRNAPNIVVTSGINMSLTKNYRANEFGFLNVGKSRSPLSIGLPPGVPNFRVEGYCANNFIKKLVPSQSINVIGAYSFTGPTGKHPMMKIVRNKTEVEYVFDNKYFDPLTSSLNYFTTPVEIRSDDSLLFSCEFDTRNKQGFVMGGNGINDEYCDNILMYYPINEDYHACTSELEIENWISFMTTLNNSGIIEWYTAPTDIAGAVAAVSNSPLLAANIALATTTLRNFYSNTPRVNSENHGEVNHTNRYLLNEVVLNRIQDGCRAIMTTTKASNDPTTSNRLQTTISTTNSNTNGQITATNSQTTVFQRKPIDNLGNRNTPQILVSSLVYLVLQLIIHIYI